MTATCLPSPRRSLVRLVTGFIEKDFRLTAIQLDNVNPTLDEITRFTCGPDGAKNNTPVDLSIVVEVLRKVAITVLQYGDHVEVFEGEQSGVHGTAQSVEQDIVTITPVGVDFDRSCGYHP